jgi:hypothetical protein
MAKSKTKERKVTIPEGYEDEAAFIKEARERFQQDLDFDRENRDEGVFDLKFAAGEQWTREDLAAREGRPCLTINTLPQFIAQVVGDIRVNKPSIKVRPAEDADEDLATVREGLMRAIQRDNDAQGIYADVGQSQVTCGIGNFAIGLKNATLDGFSRDISMEVVPDPFAVVWDCMSAERTGKDAGHVFVVDEMQRKEFEATYKDELPSDLTVPINDPAGWSTKDTVRVTLYWIMREEAADYAMLEGGSIVEVEADKAGGYLRVQRTGRKVKNVPLAQPISVDEDGAAMVRTGKRRWASGYLITGTCVLAGPYDLNIDRVPVLRAQGWVINVGAKRVRFGLVRFARDPQRLKNFDRSVAVESIALAPKEKWLASTTAIPEDREDDFRRAAKSADPLLLYEGVNKPDRTAPPQVPAALMQDAALHAQDMKDVTGLHDASLGARSNETSGKAINARQREGDVANYIYHDNLKAAIMEGGRIIDQLLPAAYDTARTIRTIGEDETVKVQRINDPNDPKSIDINRGRYDIVVDTGPSYSTKRVEAAESMMQFVQSNPAAAQVAGDLIARAQDWPMADEIADRLKRAIPAQLTESDDDEKSPEQMQAKQQAMQQAQEQQQIQVGMAKLEMAKQEAEVHKLTADANYTQAQAMALGQEKGPTETPLDLQLKEQQVRKARFDADRAMFEAQKAEAEVPKVQATAERERIAVHSDFEDLRRKPMEAAHQEADLDIKLNPPKPEAADTV